MDLVLELIAVAREQRDALRRHSQPDFEALASRRVELTASLHRLSTAVALSPRQAAAIERRRQELARLDAEMQSMLQSRMAAIQQSLAGLRRSKKAVDSYATLGSRVPSFIDKKR